MPPTVAPRRSQAGPKRCLSGLRGLVRRSTASDLPRLRDLEDRYRALMHGSRDPAVVLTVADGLPDRFVEANDAAARLFGLTAEELLARPPLDFLPPDQLGRVPDLLAAVQRPNQSEDELTVRTPDGRHLTVEVRALRCRSGTQDALFIQGRDVTEQRRAREDLSWSHGVYASLAGISRVILTSVDTPADDVAALILEHARAMTGSPLGLVAHLHRESGRLLCPAAALTRDGRGGGRIGLGELEPLWGRVLEDGLPLRLNDVAASPLAWRGATPPVRRFLAAPVHAGDGLTTLVALADAEREYTPRDEGVLEQMAGLYATALHRQRATEAVRRSEERYRLLADFATDTISRITADGRILYVSPAAEALVGVPPYQLVGRRVAALIHPEDRTEAQRSLVALLRTGAAQVTTWRLRRRDGRCVWVETRSRLAHDDEEAGGVIVSVSRDVTERVESAQELARARDAAEAATRAKSEFLANMSHEIRTPLTAMLGHADLAADPGRPVDELVRHVDVVRRNGRHLLGVINDILDLSKLEAGRLTPDPRPCDAVAVVADVVDVLRLRATEKGLALDVALEAPLPETIVTDEARVRQCLFNLVGNAVKFTGTGGVRVAVSLGEDDYGQTALRIAVHDTGPGIDAADRDRLFRPFEQADASTSRRHGGTGLGLAITRRLAAVLEGSVTAESTLGQGSTFTLTLPTGPLDGVRLVTDAAELAARVRPRAAAPPAAPHARLDGYRLLLAEDGPDNQALLRLVLEQAGATVEIVGDGRAAYERALAGGYDAVLMDMQMPEMDGYEATRRLRTAGFVRPVLALTAHTMPDDRERCFAAGCSDFVPKPIDRAALLRAVHDRVAAGGGAGEPWTAAGSAAPAAGARPRAPRALRSELSGDPALVALVEAFVDALPERVAELATARTQRDHLSLKRLAHRLKGAGGSYGFPALTAAARVVERAAGSGAGADLDVALGELGALCDAIGRGHGRAWADERAGT